MSMSAGVGRRNVPGFTLIELMIVVAIIGILAAIVAAKFVQMTRKANEGAAKGNLGQIRSAISMYYGDMEGQYPGDVNALTISGKYLAAIPSVLAPDYHGPSAGVRNFSGGCQPFMAVADDFGVAGWAYCAAPADLAFGTVVINCTHTDTRSSVWTNF